MRELSEKEMEAVSGAGCGSRIREYDAPWCGSTDPAHDHGGDDGGEIYYWHDNTQGGGGTGGGGDPLPQGNIEAIRAAALSLANLIRSSGVEFQGAVYLFEGNVFITPPESTYSSTGGDGSLFFRWLPPGAHVVGFVHNHPGRIEAIPSAPGFTGASNGVSNDWSHRDWLVSSRFDGFTVDPNILYYVATSQEVREFSGADEGTTNPLQGLLL